MYLIARMIRVDDSVGNMFNSFFLKPTSFTMRLTIFNAYELSVNNSIHFNGFKLPKSQLISEKWGENL